MKMLKALFAAAFLLVAPLAHAQIGVDNSAQFGPSNAYNWSALQTFSGGLSIPFGGLTMTTTTQPTGTGGIFCCILNNNNTITFPTNSQLFRSRAWTDNVTAGAAQNGQGINESNFFQQINTLNGPVNLQNESNVIHAYIENDIGTGCVPVTNCQFSGQQENFEASYTNHIAINNMQNLLALVNNASDGTISAGKGIYGTLSNDNVTPGSIGTFAFLNLEAMTGAGSLPTNYYFARNADSHAVISTVGPLILSSTSTLTGANGQLNIQTKDTSSGTFNTVIKNSLGGNILLFDNAGDLTTTGHMSADSATFSTTLKNTPIGLAGPASALVTTLGASGTVTFTSLTASLPVCTDASKNLSSTCPASNQPVLIGTTGSIGGGVLLAGACTSGTVAVTNSTTAMAVVATPVTYPGDGVTWSGYVSTAGTVTVKVCAIVGLTPGATTYNVRVIQ